MLFLLFLHVESRREREGKIHGQTRTRWTEIENFYLAEMRIRGFFCGNKWRLLCNIVSLQIPQLLKLLYFPLCFDMRWFWFQISSPFLSVVTPSSSIYYLLQNRKLNKKELRKQWKKVEMEKLEAHTPRKWLNEVEKRGNK